MGLLDTLLMRTFGLPRGLLGRIGGRLMVRGKAQCGRWLIDELNLEPESSVLDIGCGPGVILGLLAEAVPHGRVVGLDPSVTMLRQAAKRNADMLARGVIELLQGEAESLPLDNSSFDVIVALNSMQLWNDPGLGIQECRRVLRPSGLICIGFTPEAREPSDDPEILVHAAGFANVVTKLGIGAKWTFAQRA